MITGRALEAQNGVAVAGRTVRAAGRRAAWRLDDPCLRLALAAGLGGLAAGLAAAVFYWRADLTLSHYDARGHLVVARRIFDSLTPGWVQIGAVWLPLPHLLNAIPVQVDAWYRSGASAVLFSVLSHAVAAGAAAHLIVRATGSRAGALAAAALLALNPNVLYLQSTPMTEPLLLGLTLLGVAWLYDWLEEGGRGSARGPGVMLAAACLTRYEAWPMTAAAVGCAALVLLGQRRPAAEVARAVGHLIVWPAAAVVLFLVLSRATVGRWFVASGFFVPDNPALGDPLRAAAQVAGGLWWLAGPALTLAAAAAVIAILAVAARSPHRTALLLGPALGAAAALPAYAFLQGHPFRIRYMVPLVAAAAVSAGLGIGLLRRGQAPAAAGLVALTLWLLPPFDGTAAMVREAQWDRPNSAARQAVTRHLADRYGGEMVLASMGSLGHYMQEASHAGLRIRDFLHEGNGELWQEALASPRRHVGWILIEERAEGGDMLFRRARERPEFLDGFTRVAEGGGAALYRRHQASGAGAGPPLTKPDALISRRDTPRPCRRHSPGIPSPSPRSRWHPSCWSA